MTEVIKIDACTWRIEDGFVRFFLLAGKKQAVLIDSGVATPNAKEIAEQYTDLPILLLNTHGDGDHVSGTAAFSEIYMGEADYEGCGVAARFPETALVPVADGQIFDLGGRTLKCVSIPGHTCGSIAVLDVERRVLYAGDSVQDGNVFMFGKHRAPQQYEASLKKLVAMAAEYDTVIGSHGTPELPADYVGKVLAGWQATERGEIGCEEVDMHGNQVKLYKTVDCGFLC